MTQAFLADRAFLLIGGADADAFLQNLITTDLPSLQVGETAPGALLTPQGKIMFSFLISREGDGFRLETDSASRDNLLKRLMMYRLRAQVELAPAEETGVTVALGEDIGGLADRRFARAGVTLQRKPGGSDTVGGSELYNAWRVASAVAEAPDDYALGDAFPHDILLDRNGGLSFRKGCYVGQEVVSRMQHRATARRRLVIVSAPEALPPSSSTIMASGKAIGTLGTVAGNQGLAVVRIDKAGAAMAAGEPLLAGDMTVTLSLPEWSELSFPAEAAGDEA